MPCLLVLWDVTLEDPYSPETTEPRAVTQHLNAAEAYRASQTIGHFTIPKMSEIFLKVR